MQSVWRQRNCLAAILQCASFKKKLKERVKLISVSIIKAECTFFSQHLLATLQNVEFLERVAYPTDSLLKRVMHSCACFLSTFVNASESTRKKFNFDFTISKGELFIDTWRTSLLRQIIELCIQIVLHRSQVFTRHACMHGNFCLQCVCMMLAQSIKGSTQSAWK